MTRTPPPDGPPMRTMFVSPDAPTRCPHCAVPMTAHTSRPGRDRPPREGDYAVCAHCRRPSMFTSGVLHRAALRILSAEELAEFERAYPGATSAGIDELRTITDEVGCRVRYGGEAP